MTKSLITGVTGLIGSHLAEFLLRKGHRVWGLYLKTHPMHVPVLRDKKIHYILCDLNSKRRLQNLILRIRPRYLFHLGAQSYVRPSWEDPEYTLRTNILSTLWILEAARRLRPSPTVVLASSSAEYGSNLPSEVPIRENKEFRPSSPYAVSKVASDMLGYLYAQAYPLRILRARYFNTTGPRKVADACSDFAFRIAQAEKRSFSKIPVGNLRPIRDITDVRDVVRATWLIAQKGKNGEAYNVCSGRAISVGRILKILLSLSKGKIHIFRDSKLLRRMDDPIFVGDCAKLRKLGWRPRIPIQQTLKDLLNFWRQRV
ncbi:MAG: GDP-mannose 4,6-dehydratase [Elusimicrobia bacterium]|nr:GDP-mannose 4,6-dehydratase [Elusimicrobiota bacterium]